MHELCSALGVEGLDDGDVKMGGMGRTKSGFEGVQKAVEKVTREGYSATQILSQVYFSVLVSNLKEYF